MSETDNNPTTAQAEAEAYVAGMAQARQDRERAERARKQDERGGLAQVKAGDTVYVLRGFQIYPVAVTRVTDATIFVGSAPYKRENGEERSRWSRDYIYPALPHIVARYEAQEQEKHDKAEAERLRDYLREHLADMEESATGATVYHIGAYAMLSWDYPYEPGGYRYRLYVRNEEAIYKPLNGGNYSSLADALAALAGAIVTTDAERLTLIRLIAGKE